jgi:hypothetical protein
MNSKRLSCVLSLVPAPTRSTMKPEGDLELGAAGVAAVAARRQAHKKADMRHHDGQKRSWWSRAWRGKEEYRKTDNVSGSRGSSLKDESTDVDGPPPTLSPRLRHTVQ